MWRSPADGADGADGFRPRAKGGSRHPPGKVCGATQEAWHRLLGFGPRSDGKSLRLLRFLGGGSRCPEPPHPSRSEGGGRSDRGITRGGTNGGTFPILSPRPGGGRPPWFLPKLEAPPVIRITLRQSKSPRATDLAYETLFIQTEGVDQRDGFGRRRHSSDNYVDRKPVMNEVTPAMIVMFGRLCASLGIGRA